VCEVWKEVTQLIDQTKERTKGRYVGGSREVSYCCKPVRVWAYPSRGHHIAGEGDLLAEAQLLAANGDPVLAALVQDRPNRLVDLLLIHAFDKDIVYNLLGIGLSDDDVVGTATPPV
jgi:hypothetical protein